MKVYFLRTAIIILGWFSILGCVKNIDEELVIPPTVTPPTVLPILINTKLTELNLAVQDSISIYFTNEFKGFKNPHLINEIKYYPYLIELSIEGVAIDSLWSDTTLLKVWGKELFPQDDSLKLSIIIEWRDSAFVEENQTQFSIKTSAGVLPIEEINSSYPVDRQYYFLKNEYNNGFFKVSRLPSDISQLSVSIIDNKQNIISTSGLIKNQEQMRLDFDLPNLLNEELYAIELKNGENILKRVDFRTSKFNTYSEKIANMVFFGATRGLHIPMSQHYLIQYAKNDSEGFDKSETTTALENTGGTDYEYCIGLVQLEFIPEGNVWYNTYIYPLVYAPFPDPNFDPNYPYHPNLGAPPFRAMNFYFTDSLPSLLDDEIASGVGSQISPSNFGFMNYVGSASAYDFFDMQQAVVNKYINDTNVPERIAIVIAGGYPIIQPGIYKFIMNYTLPDGTISSTRTYEMIYN